MPRQPDWTDPHSENWCGSVRLAELDVVGLMGDSAATESELEVVQPFVEHQSFVAVARTEVEEAKAVLASTLDAAVEDGIECVQAAPLVRGGDVLSAHHARVAKEQYPRED